MSALDWIQESVDQAVEPIGAGHAQWAFAALAAGLLLATVISARRRGIGVYRMAIGLVGTALLAALAVDVKLFDSLERISFLSRIRALMGLVSALVLLVTIESVRRSHLRERYAILWVTTAAMILLCAIFPSVLDFFCAFLGMQYVTFAVAVIFTFLTLVSFHFSIALSALSDDRARLAQRYALLEARLRECERRLQAEPVPPPQDSQPPPPGTPPA